MKRKVIALLLASLMANSFSAFVYAGTEEVVPSADIFNVDFINGTADTSPLQNGEGQAVGSPEIIESSELYKNIAEFDGWSAYTYSFTPEKLEKINETITMECMVKFHSIPNSGEKEIFSMQEYGGIGLGISNGKLTFFAHVDGKYRELSTAIRAEQWYHIAGVVDGTEVKLYVNGEQKAVNTDARNPGITYPSVGNARKFVLGGDSDEYEAAENLAEADMSFARIYSTPLSGSQISQLSKNTFEGTDIQYGDIVDLGLIASDRIAEEAGWDLNLHVSDRILESADKIEYDVVYDTNLLEYRDVQHLKNGAEITKTEGGRLHIIVSSDALWKDDFRKYSSTRIGKLNFKINSVEETTDTMIRTENFRSFCQEEEILDNAPNQAEKTLTIYSKSILDKNGDGVIGAGDVALAEDDMKTVVAESAAIYPYKHVVILTIDGAGAVWNPDYIYYAENQWSWPQKYTDAETMAKRENTYAMKLLNEEFAMSYTAQSVIPAISAQNYFSILHGVPWMDVPEEYQVDNDIAADYYFADFGAEEPVYPSIFQVVAQAYPERQNAAFSEWEKIVNGIIEPDAQVAGTASEESRSFYDVADYIKSPEFNNTAVVYAQSDHMDHTGHGQGYFTDVYWKELKLYDEQYKAVMDALEESGHRDDTLILTNADHGGHKQDHGSEDACDMDIFMGAWGQTVNSGVRLEGGSNADISPTALAGLRTAKPDSMTGQVFDENVFLIQEEMSKKNRDIENIIFERGVNGAVLSLVNPKSETRVIDVVIDLKENEVNTINTENGTILRQKIEDGKLKLTISYKEQPTKLAEILYQTQGETQPVLEEIMLGTESGEEIYPDIQNTDKANSTQEAAKKSLGLAIAMAEKLEQEQAENYCYTEDSWRAVQEALDAARIVMEDTQASVEEADNVFLDLLAACNLLEYSVQRVGLKAAIDGTEAILANSENLSKYTEESINTVKAALTEAQNVYASSAADQGTINNAATGLFNAVTSLLEEKGDTRLEILIRAAESLLSREAEYTSASVQNLKDALDRAKAALENPEAIQEELNQAYKELAEAMTSLVRKTNKEELKSILDKAEKILSQKDRYLESAIAGLGAVKEEAQAVYDNEDADAEAVGEAVKKLVAEILKARLMGDVDLNGTVDSQDAAKLLKYDAELEELTEEQLQAADVNGDETADSSDAVSILQYAAEFIRYL